MKNSSASNSGAVIFTILFSAALLYTNGIVSPALATIGQAFPDKSAETVQLIYSIPKIMLFICSLLSGVIASRLSIKKCMVLGCVFRRWERCLRGSEDLVFCCSAGCYLESDTA